MKRSLYIILSVVLLVGGNSLNGQENKSQIIGEAEMLTGTFNTAVDSLRNSFYLQQYHNSLDRHDKNVSLADFDAIPDSIIAKRLKSLHTVIPMTYNSVVRDYIRLYLKIMSRRMQTMLTLSEHYHPMFEEVLSHYGVPEELKYLTIVESAMNPMATSRAGAAGLWQFMYHTGKNYDLEVNSLVDERRDPYRSTVAAARHLRDLNRIFKDWTLAIAAYNCGSGNINKAISRSGGKRDFWELYSYLPRETRGYIPAFIAATYVMNYYPEHGLKPEKIVLPESVDTVGIRSDVLYSYVCDYCGVTLDELHSLNPQFKTDYIPASSGRYAICLPSSKIHQFIASEDSIYSRTQDSLSKKPAPVVVEQQQPKGGNSKSSGSTVYHKVKQGETLYKIAKKYGTTPQAIKKRNNMKSDKIRVGQKLRVK